MGGHERFAGRVVVVTGGASGIGLAAARLFAAEGARLALVDREAAALEAAVAALGGEVLALPGDVGCEATVEAHAATVAERLGPVDVLLTAAGWSNGLSVPDCPLDAWQAILRTNLDGTFLWCRAALRQMLTAGQGGALVLVGSQLALAGGRANAAYLASKGAVMSLARSMAFDHVAAGIRVNVVVPGAIDTPLLRRSFARAADPAAAEARSVARHPMGRLGRAEEVARAALWLASDEASFTTGTCLPVDGGWLAG
jgi:NAD(P)-dependent dehydrogenase (short-subunit alcohol dehydrogenase family)